MTVILRWQAQKASNLHEGFCISVAFRNMDLYYYSYFRQCFIKVTHVRFNETKQQLRRPVISAIVVHDTSNFEN